MFTFEIPGQPVAKQRPRKGKNGRFYTPAATKQYERHASTAAVLARPPNWDLSGAFSVEFALYLPCAVGCSATSL